MLPKDDFNEYYRTETNRRLINIEQNIDKLLQLRSQLILFSLIGSGVISIMITISISFISH